MGGQAEEVSPEQEEMEEEEKRRAQELMRLRLQILRRRGTGGVGETAPTIGAGSQQLG